LFKAFEAFGGQGAGLLPFGQPSRKEYLGPS
jgi:hypothetical protein